MFIKDKIKRILIFEVGCIGDTLATVPALKVMREKFPDARIDRIAIPMVRELLETCPYIDGIMLYDRDGTEKRLTSKIRFLFSMRSKKYDLFVNLHIPSPNRRFIYYLRDNLFAYLIGAKYRVGYWVRGTGIWLTDGPLADNMDRRPAASAILELANYIIKYSGISKSGEIASPSARNDKKERSLRGAQRRGNLIEDRSNKTDDKGFAWFTSLDEEHANLLLDHYNIRREDLLIGIHPGTRHRYARWVNEQFARVGDELISKYNARVIFTGNGNDVATVRDIAGLMKKDAIILTGTTTLKQLAAIIKRCCIYISVDTGPLHMAVSLGTPTISLFSGRDFAEKWTPYGNENIVIRKDIPCSPCFKLDCDDNKCMRMIEVSDVLEAVERLIRGRFYFSQKIEPSPTTILQVITGLDIGGAERVVYSIAKSLDPARYRVIVCCLKEDGIIADEIRKSGVKVINLNRPNPWDIRAVLTLSKIIKEEKIDLVHTHIARADVIGGLAARLRGVPVISTVHHTYEPWENHPFYGNIYRKTLNSFDRIIAVSKAVREYLIRWGRVPQEKITVIYNGIDISEYERVDLTRAGANNGKVVGTVARLDSIKGHQYLLKAASQVIKVLPETKFLIVGDGKERRILEDMAVDMGIKEHIIFTGWRKDIPNVLSRCNLFVLPALKEGLGLAILEAMAAKLAVIATDVDGIKEVVKDGITGLLVSTPHDTNKLASAVIRLLSNPREAHSMGIKGHEKARGSFSISRMKEGIVQVYESILA